MIGAALHRFDQQLCSYATGNVRIHLDRPRFAEYARAQLDPAIWAYLKALEEDDEPPELLLSDEAFQDLSLAFEDSPCEFDPKWETDEALHRRSITCMSEIREVLAPEYARQWAQASASFAEQLDNPRTRLSEGIVVVHDWCCEVRRLLRAMGAIGLLPRPEGAFPTPLNTENDASREDTRKQPRSHPRSSESAKDQSFPSDLAQVLDRLAVSMQRLGDTQAQPVPAALSKEDAARYIGVDVPAIEYLIRAKKLAYVQYGSQRGRVISVADLHQFLQDHREMTGDELRRRHKPR